MSRHLGSVSQLRHSRAFRSIARIVIAGQWLMLLPANVATVGAQTPVASFASARTTDDEEIETLLADYLLGAEQRPTPRAAGAPGESKAVAPGPKRVVVNRTVPRVAPPPSAPSFSAEPTDLEFRRVRIFAEALVPLGRPTRPEENRALAAALSAYVERGDAEAVGGVLDFLLRFPDSPWRPSLMANVGTVFSQTGYYSRALRSWDEAWRLANAATDVNGRAVADYALGQWLDLVGRLGQANLLAARLDEIKDRGVGGAAAQKVTVAREGLWILQNRHHDAVASASVAVGGLIDSLNKGTAGSLKMLTAHHPSDEGTSLRAVQRLAQTVGFAGRMAYRTREVEPVVPAILHLQLGHYAALIKSERGLYLVRDAILGDRWITRRALDDEQSGYFLIPEGQLPPGWRAVDNNEAAVVIGHCAPGAPDDLDPGAPPSGPGPCPQGECEPGMPTYNFHPVTAALRLHDAPLSYLPARGPAMFFSVHYNHRGTSNPQVPVFGNLGPQWEMDWLSWIQETPGGQCAVQGCTFSEVFVHLRGYGAESYAGAPDFTSDFGTHWRSRARLVRTSLDPIRYERRLPNGSVEVFDVSDGAPVRYRRVFLSRVIDPQGQQVDLTYDSSLRLVALTDALGQVTTVHYESADPLRITKVTDPFGRFASFTYNDSGRLASITDAIGMTSSFAYGSGDFITAMTTPYGTTTFRQETTLATVPRFIEATDPMGGTERLEYHVTHPTLSATAPAGEVPTGFTTYNVELNKYVSLAWSKRAMALHPGDVTKATVTHWLINRPVQAFLPYMHHASSVPHSIKRPLEGRQWFSYPNQTSVGTAGDGTQPAKVARVMDDGTSQISQATYNTSGRMTSRTDPLGRRMSFVYAANGIDLIEERNTTGSLNELTASYGGYDALHRAATSTDAAGQSTATTYNANGQMLTDTNAKNETTTYTYDSQGLLQTLTGAVSGFTINYTYDAYGRVHTVTDPLGYVTTTTYDALDRVIKVTYPDGTFEESVYDRLDLVRSRDRKGRWTHHFYDALRRLTSTRDPLGRVVRKEWCTCGDLNAIVDGKNQKTRWERDLQGRITREVRADGVSAYVYTYEATTSRLKTITDPKLQVLTHTYYLDGQISQRVFTNAAVPTPTISYTYDTNYSRIATMTDGTGTTSYSYGAAGALGALQLTAIDGPLTNDTVTFSYDELWRITSRSVNSVAATRVYDSMGRVSTETNPLGTFTYDYVGVSQQVSSILYPNGETREYAYFGNTNDRRVQTIHNKRAGGTTISKYDYTYDSVGNLLTWQQQSDSNAPIEWRYRYDGADQLLGATKWSTGGTPSVLQRQAYSYDAAANLTTEQIDDTVTVISYDVRNRPIERRSGGALRVVGFVNEPATVSINGQPAEVAADGQFVGMATVAPGTTRFSVQAIDASGNSVVRQWDYDSNEPLRTYVHDANGNLTSDGVRAFEWDATNQLVAATTGVSRYEYAYNGLARRTQAVWKDNGVTQSQTQYVWCDKEICEERVVVPSSSVRALYPQGELVNGAARFYLSDHLGSVTETLDSSATLVSRRRFTPTGAIDSEVGPDAWLGFAGLRPDETGTLNQAIYRSYDPDLHRWLSEDPMGMVDGPNLFSYVKNNPLRSVDPWGLCTCDAPCPSRNWQFDSISISWGPWMAAISGGIGRYRCVGKPLVGRWASVFCATWGITDATLQTQVNLQVQGVTQSGPCKPEDLKSQMTTAYQASYGPVSTDSNRESYGLSAGWGGTGIARVDCRITPK